jgi:beta-phosphoglucomutase-like phosphatase (HAD superfamily)
MQQRKLVLFDIDGTLMNLEVLAEEAFRSMTKEVYGMECSFFEISYSGKTDPQILEEVLMQRGFDREVIWHNFNLAHDKYCDYFDYFAKRDEYILKILPGVRVLLKYLQEQKGLYMGILTGNIE